MSLWAIIRECVGKDLTRICLPVYFNEPLSALQKLAEDLEYSALLDQARLPRVTCCEVLGLGLGQEAGRGPGVLGAAGPGALPLKKGNHREH